VLKSSHGLWGEFQFSNIKSLAQFCQSWNTFTADLQPSAAAQGKSTTALLPYRQETLPAAVIPETALKPDYVPEPAPAVTIDDGSMLQAHRAWVISVAIIAVLMPLARSMRAWTGPVVCRRLLPHRWRRRSTL
jgi:hypothetical protein